MHLTLRFGRERGPFHVHVRASEVMFDAQLLACRSDTPTRNGTDRISEWHVSRDPIAEKGGRPMDRSIDELVTNSSIERSFGPIER